MDDIAEPFTEYATIVSNLKFSNTQCKWNEGLKSVRNII